MHLNESVSASPEYSPGVVLDSEVLLREMFNPQHIVDGNVVVTAVPLTELRSAGFSVHRKEHVSFESVKESMERRLLRPRRGEPWKDEGVAEILTGEVRGLRNDGERALVVIDTALSDNRGHASIYAAKPELGDAHARKLRSLLIPLLQNRKPVEQVFEAGNRDQGIERGGQVGIANRIAQVFQTTGLSRIWCWICHAVFHCGRPSAEKRDRERGGY